MCKRTLILMLVFVLAGCASGGPRAGGGGKVVRMQGGTEIPKQGIVMDASYDKTFDSYFPGYKVVSVAMHNGSFNIIPLNPELDKWSVRIGKKNYPAIHDLRKANPAMWNRLSGHHKNLISYPLVLAIGAEQVVDLFLPDDIEVEEFTDIVVYFDSFKTTYQISARQ